MSRDLPALIGISAGDHRCGRDLVSLAEGAARGGLRAIILRESLLGERALVDLARRLAPTFGEGLLLHGRSPAGLEIAERSGWGLHLPDRLLEGAPSLAEHRRAVRGLLGQSVHDAAGLAAAADAGLDYVILAPVFAPGSKPGDVRPTLGIAGLIALIAGAGLPVYALGGVGPEAAGACIAAGAIGVASLSALFGPEATPESAERAARALLLVASAARSGQFGSGAGSDTLHE